MRKFLSISLLVSGILSSSLYAQQIPNSGFENWDNSAGYYNPEGWANTNAVTALTSVYTTTKGTPGAPGSAYLKLTTKQLGNKNIPGIAVSGTISNYSLDSLAYSGFAYNQRPTALKGNWQYMAMSGTDKGAVLALLTKWNNTTNSRDTVGIAQEVLLGMEMSWQPFSIPFTYSSQEAPDSAVIIITSSGFGSTITLNSYVYIDNLSFDEPTSITPIANNEMNIQISPNPATDKIKVSFDADSKSKKYSYTILDVQGRIIQSKTITQIPFVISTYNLKAGLYILKIQDDKSNFQQKFIVQ